MEKTLAELASAEEGTRLRLEAGGFFNPTTGRFEVQAITVGEGNGYQFSEACLRESLPLWEGVSCFVDHSLWGHSVRDLGGIFSNARWDEQTRGIRLELHTLGPSGRLVEELGRQILAEEGAKPGVGFSADILFTSKQREALKIIKVYSLDLVFNPARGGAFVRALNHRAETCQDNSAQATANVEEGRTGGWSMVEEVKTQDHASVQLQQESQAVRRQMCAYLLESGLAAAKLPAPMADHLRKQFAGRIFAPQELEAAIEEGRGLVSALTSGQAVVGPVGRIQQMFSSEDQLQAAVDDLLGAPRQPGAESLQVHRLTGIRELYHTLTGD